MSVFVDDMAAPYGRFVLCHMIADSTTELLAMAKQIGVSRRWLQAGGTYREHYDICLAKRHLAIAAGAIPITMKELGRRVHQRRGKAAA